MASPLGRPSAPSLTEHLISVVIPVYRGEAHLPALVEELAGWTEPAQTAGGRSFRVIEILLVHDCGPDDSDRVIRGLAARHDFVRPVWLSRNFGQHAATMAGMASSSGEWIVTMDEDGQHDPAAIATMLDAALDGAVNLVYASPTNKPPHSAFRNTTSRLAKWTATKLSGGADASSFHSFRLILGEVGRSVAAYAGAGIYLDVALGWVAGSPATAPVQMRDEGTRRSGYSVRALLSHFWRMVLTGGTRALRAVGVLGMVFALVGLVLAGYLGISRLVGADVPAGWTSLAVIMLVCTGAILFAIGVIAEYLGVAVNMAMGKPLYLIIGDPMTGPLGRDAANADRPPRR